MSLWASDYSHLNENASFFQLLWVKLAWKWFSFYWLGTINWFFEAYQKDSQFCENYYDDSKKNFTIANYYCTLRKIISKLKYFLYFSAKCAMPDDQSSNPAVATSHHSHDQTLVIATKIQTIQIKHSSNKMTAYSEKFCFWFTNY